MSPDSVPNDNEPALLGAGIRKDAIDQGAQDVGLSGTSFGDPLSLASNSPNRRLLPLPRRRSAVATSAGPQEAGKFFGDFLNRSGKSEDEQPANSLTVPVAFHAARSPSSNETREGSPTRRKSFSAFPNVTLTPPRERSSSSFNSRLEFGGRQSSSSAFTFNFLHNMSSAPTLSPTPNQSQKFNSSISELSGNLANTALLGQPRLLPAPSTPPEPITNLFSDEKIFVGARTTGLSNESSPSSNIATSEEPTVYDVNSEETPREPFFSPIFQNALRESIAVVDRAVASLKTCGLNAETDANISRLVSEAEHLKSTNDFGSRTIAVVGDSGEGKSRIINSLLHIPGLAKEGEIGTACTSVVTEYRQRQPRHKAFLTLEVDRLASSEIRELVAELVYSYRRIYLPEVEESVDPIDYSHYETESEVAWSTLEAAFSHKEGFCKNFLEDQSPEASERITSQLIDWIDDLPWPDAGQSDVWEVDSVEECNEKTDRFMGDRLWPFTRSIRVYVSAQVLKTGVVLADLPGLRDTNLARVRATEKYLKKCDHIFLVTNIQRAITSQSLKSSLYSVLRDYVSSDWEVTAAHNLKIAIVCTKAEDMDAEGLRRAFVGPGKAISESTMDELDREIHRAKKNGDWKRKKRIKQRQEYILIKARNDHVSKGLKEAYARKAGGLVDVFCVANRDYNKFCRKGDVEYVKRTGVPELRRFCHFITATSQFVGAKNYLQSTLPGFLNSIKLLTEIEPVEDNLTSSGSENQVLEGYKKLKTELKEHVRTLKQAFETDFDEQILQLNRRIPIWERDAGNRSDEWNTLKFNQYQAWCVNNGKHFTRNLGHINWNSELIWKMRSEQEYNWGLLMDEIPTLFNTLISSSKHSFRQFSSLALELIKSPSFFQKTKFCRVALEYQLLCHERIFLKELKLIHSKASSDSYGSYIVDEMTPTYRAAASAPRGSGALRRRTRIVHGKVTSDMIENVALKIQQDVETLSNRAFDTSPISQDTDTLLQAAALGSSTTPPTPDRTLGSSPEGLTISNSINKIFKGLEKDLLCLLVVAKEQGGRLEKEKEKDAREVLRTALAKEEAIVENLNEMVNKIETGKPESSQDGWLSVK